MRKWSNAEIPLIGHFAAHVLAIGSTLLGAWARDVINHGCD